MDILKARKYWNKLKQRLSEEGSELVTICHQLKMIAEDGKMRLTDVANTKGILRIIQSIPSKSARNHQEIMALEALEELELKNTAEEDEAILYEYIKAHGGVSATIASQIISGVSKRTAQRRLNDMVEKGMIRMVGATNNLKYVDNIEG